MVHISYVARSFSAVGWPWMAVEKFRGLLSVHWLHELTVMGVKKTEAKTNYGKEKGLARFEEPWPGIATQKMLSATFSL